MSSSISIKNKIEADRVIKVSPFKKEIRRTTPHKHNNYFEIIYLSKGGGNHFIDSRKYPVKPPIMYFIRKEQVHYWELDQEPEGFVVIIKRSFIEISLDDELKSLFTKISGQNSLGITDNLTINSIFTLLTKENRESGKNAFHITEGLLKALLGKVLDVAKPLINNVEIKSNLYQAYNNLLNANNKIKNRVAFYAEQLNTSPQNLNAVCRKATNKSASKILAEFITNEAKRLLLYTDKSVSEISIILGFKDASHFVKYFKRFTEQTPQSFRNNA
ncbi:AraC family transcriptional activator of pobA [Pedobacter sp. CG_S7]|uniref:AraC family transcriptional regulator n=1 Tax=Pedobacter sp. CG_S7 TaxID=3143930 RepID=UPI003396DB31